MGQSLYNIPLKTIDGQDATLANDRSLIVLGCPSNDFAGQEPGNEASIAEFCRGNFGVQFPMFAKVNINSVPRLPMYAALIDAMPRSWPSTDGQLETTLRQHGLPAEDATDDMWSFEKSLIARDGRVVGRFAPDVTVDSPALAEAIKTARMQQPARQRRRAQLRVGEQLSDACKDRFKARRVPCSGCHREGGSEKGV